MLYFKDWQLCIHGELARQYDNLTRRIEVEGDLPAGWDWAALVQVGDYLDIIALTETESGIGVDLTAQMLAVGDAWYTIQLRGIQGELVRHTNPVQTYVGASLSGDAKWPEIPSEFIQLEQSAWEAANRAEDAADKLDDAIGQATYIGFEMNEEGELVAVLSPAAEADFELTENGELEVFLNG